MQSSHYRFAPLLEFTLNVILVQKITNQSTNQKNKMNKKSTLNELFLELSRNCFYSSFNAAYGDADLIDFKIVVSLPILSSRTCLKISYFQADILASVF